MTYQLPRSLMSIIGIIALIWSSIWQVPLAAAAASLTISPITWDVIGLDSNKVTDGPDTFMVGARVCNTGNMDATNVVSNFVWDSVNTFITLSGASSLSVATLTAGACTDFYYNILITRNSAAYDSMRGYHITAVADTLATISTPTPRQLYVEKLVSQARNSVASISGAKTVVVGQTYQYVVNSSTATGGYEQLDAFLNFPNVMFQLISVASTYTSPTGGANDKVYANACGWDSDPTHVAPNSVKTYRSCIGPVQYTGGKAGGTIVTTYNVKILSAGTATLTTLIYDFSGSSYHYNGDFGVGVNLITVTATSSSPPVASNDSATTTGTTPATLTPATNDTTSSGTTLAAGTIDLDPTTAGQQTTRTTAQGAWVLNTATGTVTFTPVAGFVGAATIPYTIQNNAGQTSNQANLTVTVSAPSAPIATNDNTTTTGTTPTTLMPAGNDTAGGNGATLAPGTIDLDPSTAGQDTTLTVAGQGAWTLNTTTGQVTFISVAGYTGTATIPYTIKDNYGTTSNQADLSVTVSVPTAPIANDDSAPTTGTNPVTLTPVTNDVAGAGATLVVGTIDLDPATPGQQTTQTTAQGAWALNTTTGQVTFTPAAGFVGTASIPYTIQDSYGQTSNVAILSVTVSKPVAPTANDDSATTTGTTPATLTPAGNDTDGGNGAVLAPGTIDLDLATPGQQTTRTTVEGIWALDTGIGSVTFGQVTFLPGAGFKGTATIPYTIQDNYGTSSNQATLSVTVSAPVAPIANDDSTTTTGTNPVTLVPVANDTAGVSATLMPGTIDLDPITPLQQTTRTTADGSWTLDTGAGQVTFIPAVGLFPRTAFILYTIKDNYGTMSNQATLSVTVSAPPALIANPDSTTTIGTTPVTLIPAANDEASGATLVPGSIDLDLDPLKPGQQTTLTVAGKGAWTLDPTGQVTFTPQAGFVGTITIPYTIQNNAAPAQTSNQADLSVTVSAPAAPTAKDDSTSTTGTTPATLTPAGNDTDGGNGAVLAPGTIDLDPATPGQQTTRLTVEGAWALNTTTVPGQVTFTPSAGFVGTASIPYTIKDSYSQTSNVAILSVTVSKPIASPTANDDSTSTTGTTPATLMPAINDTAGGNGAVLAPGTIDLDLATPGQQTTRTMIEGTWALDTNIGSVTFGQVTFLPVAGFKGTATIPYTIRDNYGTLSNQATLLVTVGVPAPPIANNDSATTIGTTPATLTPASNDMAGGSGVLLLPSTIDLDPRTAGQDTTLSVAGEGVWMLNTTTGQVAFIPVVGFTGMAIIPYTIKDNYGTTSNQATLSVVVSKPTAPTANNDSTTTTGTNPVTLVPVANDTAGGNGATLAPSTIDLDPSTAGQDTTLTVAGKGTWTLDPTTGQVAFIPAAGFAGMATIPYTIQDNYGTPSNQATLSVLVSAPSGLTANPDTTTTIGTTPVTLMPAGNDTAGGNGATLAPGTIDLDPATPGQQTTITTTQGAWTLDTSTGAVTFTPAASFGGTASISYTIQNSYGQISNAATLSVTVSAPPAPTATDDSASTTGADPVTLTPVTNDAAGGNGATLAPGTIDLDPATPGQQTTITTTQGAWSLDTSTGQVTFIPAPGFSGTATLAYTVQNNYGETSPPAILSVKVVGATAIALASFTATRDGDQVVVRWVTTAEINTWGFQLYRSADGKRASAVRVTTQLIPGQGRGQGGASYSWTDIGAAAGVTYTYWLVETEISGATNEYGPSTASVRPAEMSYRLFMPLAAR
jgi:CshA-type fibril repeat protein